MVVVVGEGVSVFFFLQEETAMIVRRMKSGNIFFITFGFNGIKVTFYFLEQQSNQNGM